MAHRLADTSGTQLLTGQQSPDRRAAARHQDRSLTNELLSRAESAADQFGHDANHWFTSFGPTNVRLHKLAAALNLDDLAYVLERGPRIAADELPTERAVTHDLDMARAHSYAAQDEDALDRLLDAEQKAPQVMHHSATARETVKALHRRAKGTADPELTRLATTCRAIA